MDYPCEPGASLGCSITDSAGLRRRSNNQREVARSLQAISANSAMRYAIVAHQTPDGQVVSDFDADKKQSLLLIAEQRLEHMRAMLKAPLPVVASFSGTARSLTRPVFSLVRRDHHDLTVELRLEYSQERSSKARATYTH